MNRLCLQLTILPSPDLPTVPDLELILVVLSGEGKPIRKGKPSFGSITSYVEDSDSATPECLHEYYLISYLNGSSCLRFVVVQSVKALEWAVTVRFLV